MLWLFFQAKNWPNKPKSKEKQQVKISNHPCGQLVQWRLQKDKKEKQQWCLCSTNQQTKRISEAEGRPVHFCLSRMSLTIKQQNKENKEEPMPMVCSLSSFIEPSADQKT